MLKNIKRVIGNTIVSADTKRMEAGMKIKSVIPTSINEAVDTGYNTVSSVKHMMVRK